MTAHLRRVLAILVVISLHGLDTGEKGEGKKKKNKWREKLSTYKRVPYISRSNSAFRQVSTLRM
jgi:hypothetical protein